MTDSPSTGKLTGRLAAHRHLLGRAESYPDLHALPLETDGLSAREAGLAKAIDAVVVRYWSTLQLVASHHLTRRWDSLDRRVQIGLLAGAAQLLYLDRVPPHAALNESVELVRRSPAAKAASLVNAVLRRIAESRLELLQDPHADGPNILPRGDGTAWQLAADYFDEDRLVRIGQQTSHPHELVEALAQSVGFEQARKICQHGLVEAPTILTGFDVAPEGMEPHASPGFAVVGAQHDRLSQLLRKHPEWRIQDPGSSMPVRLCKHLNPKVIFDACAGRGTKTVQLARIHPDARIVATDIAEDRVDALRHATAQHENIEVIDFDERYRLSGTVDLLLLDVPCSNTGTLARRLEAKHRFSRQQLQDLVKVQRQIVANTIGLLHPSGHVLYATCSLCPGENLEQAQWIANQHSMAINNAETWMPHGLPGQAASEYRDGAFGALLGPGPEHSK